jgi:NAD(P)-dependent dehydrogenase (short-subunit alcohol dehydrogenase family)
LECGIDLEALLGRLQDKSAIITGGASGIGQATAFLFAREGAAVLVMDRDADGGAAVAETIVERGGEALFVAGDVSNEDDCRRTVRTAADRWGALHLLVNNAGIIRRASVLETTESEWDRVMAVNVKSVYLMSRWAIPAMVASGGGAIVNTSSGWGLVGGRNAAAYCASKAAVVNLTRAMALDHAAQGIRVNCVCPGDTDTAMLQDEARQLGVERAEFFREAADRPLGRVGRPEEIAEAILYLASDQAAFVTGAVLTVDGGGLAG